MLRRMICSPLFRRPSLILPIAAAILSMNFPETGLAQASASPVSPIESIQDLVARLTPEQKQQFDEATSAFNAQRFPDALAIYKELLKQLPGDTHVVVP